MNFSKTKKAILALIIANIIWGAAQPIYKWALADIPPFTFAFLRFLLAIIILYPFVYKKLKIRHTDFLTVCGMGVCGIFMNIAFLYVGLLYAPSINSSIIATSTPIFLIIASLIFLHERTKRNVTVGAFIGLAGVLAIMFKPLLMSHPSLSLLGNLFLFFSMLSSIGHTVLGRKIMKRYDPMAISFWMFLIGAILFLPLIINEHPLAHIDKILTFRSLFGITYAALLSSIAGYSLYNLAIKYMSASNIGMFYYLDPVVTIIVAAPLIHEYPDIIFVIGSLLIFGGIYIAEGRIHYHPIGKLLGRR